MALSQINAICTSCKHQFTSLPERSFLGFQKLNCPNCGEKVVYPLTNGYRTAYWVIFTLMSVFIINAWLNGATAGPNLFGIAVIFALFRDRSIRKQIESLST